MAQELTQVTKSPEVDAQLAGGSWQTITPVFDKDGNLVAFYTSPSTPLVEHYFDSETGKVLPKQRKDTT